MARNKKARKAGKRVTAWFPCENEQSWDKLAPHADVLHTVSVFGNTPSQDFFRRCAERHVGTLKLVGGEATAFDTKAHARATIEQYVRDCAETGFGGIDLDFEHVDAAYRRRYSEFMRALSDELHAIGARLSICVFAIDPDM